MIIEVSGVISDEEGLPGVTGTRRKGRLVIGVREEEENIERNGAHPLPTVNEGGTDGLQGGGVIGGGAHDQVQDKGVDREKEKENPIASLNSSVGIIEGGAHGLHDGGDN